MKLLKSISQGRTMIVIDHDMDALFELAERITVLQEGRVLVEGTPDEIKGNAEVQEAYLGGVHRAMSLLEVNGLNSYYGDRTSSSTSPCASSRMRWWRCSDATAPARARP